MNKSNLVKFWIIALLLPFYLTLTAQQPQLQNNIVTFHKYERDSFFLRWSPVDAYDWINCLDSGYYIDRRIGQGTVTRLGPYRPDFTRFTLPEEELGVQDLLLSLIYIEGVPKEDVEESFPAEFYTPEDVLKTRLEVVNFLISRHLWHIQQVGLGEVFTDLVEGESYSFIIRSACDTSMQSTPIYFQAAQYIPPPSVPMEAVWANRQVELSWPTRAYGGYYYAYQLEQSFDGVDFFLIDSSRIMNLMDTSAQEIFHVYRRTVYLDDNDTEYFFRLRAFDYFGQLTEWCTEVRGKGIPEIGLSPTISYLDQLPDNSAKIRWIIEDTFFHLVTEWQIHVAQEWEGPYHIDTAGIDAKQREVIRPIPFGTTFFRVVAIDQEGRIAASFPQLIMALDTLPPATPYDIQFKTDTSGHIYLTWAPNDESDFYGYKVFASFDTLAPFVLRHQGYLPAPQFMDTIDLQSERPFIYYKILSADERNNRSPYSELVTVPIPDILPPIEPTLHSCAPDKGRIFLQWLPSISRDVAVVRLFRMGIETETSWQEVGSWYHPHFDTVFIDHGVVPLEEYAYVMMAEDFSGNLSDPGIPLVCLALPDYQSFPLNAFQVLLTDDGELTLNWQFPDNDIFQVEVFRKVNQGNWILWRQLQPPLTPLLDAVEPDKDHTFRIRITFQDGTQSDFSAPKMIKS